MAKTILFGKLKKVEGKKGGIAIGFDELALDSGSIKDLFKAAQKETKMKVAIEPFQTEMLDEVPEPESDDEESLFEDDEND